MIGGFPAKLWRCNYTMGLSGLMFERNSGNNEKITLCVEPLQLQ
jgi:hypothetical protein